MRSLPVSADSRVLEPRERAAGEHTGEHLDEEAEAEALVAAEPLEVEDRRRLGVGGGAAPLVVGPALGDRGVAAPLGEQHLVAGHRGGRDVVDDRRLVAGRDRVRDRVGREHRRDAAERRDDRGPVLPAEADAARLGRAHGERTERAQVRALAHRDRGDAVLTRAVDRDLHRLRAPRPDRTRGRRRAARWCRRRAAS